jgi:hypothetical protein
MITMVSLFVISDGVNMAGKVTNENGDPVKDAMVAIYHGKPRMESQSTSPRFYRDCAKYVFTDENGNFQIEDLDPTYLYQLSVYASNQRTYRSKPIDPNDNPVEIRLEPIPKGLPNDRRLVAVVVGEDGAPVKGAIAVATWGRTAESSFGGAMDGIDTATTDADGRFVMTCNQPFLEIRASVWAPGFAKHYTQTMKLDGQEKKILLSKGSSIEGRLIIGGNPVAHKPIAISPRIGMSSSTQIKTDENGRFRFYGLQANKQYVLFTPCDWKQLAESITKQDTDSFVLKSRTITTNGSGETIQLGDLPLEPGHTVRGQIILPNDSADFANLKVVLRRDPAWDWIDVPINADGKFELASVPSEVYTVSVRSAKYEIDGPNLKYQVLGPSSFGIRLKSENADTSIAIPLRHVTE